jgi:hypothetical protein
LIVFGIGKVGPSTLNLDFFCFSAVGTWARGQRSCVVQQRHIHSATCSGLSAEFTGSSQAFPVEVNLVGVMDQAVEDGIGVGGVTDQRVPNQQRGGPPICFQVKCGYIATRNLAR